MTKRLVDIDDAVLHAAREAGGFATIKDTVAAGLRELTAAEARRREVLRLESGYLAPLGEPATREAAWR